MTKARELTEERMREIAAMPLDALIGFIHEPDEAEVTGLSGSRYRVKTYAFWDMEPHESELYTRVKVTGTGVRILQRYYGLDVRHPDDEFAPEGEINVSPTWTEIVAWVFLMVLIVALIIPWFVGVAYLVSRLL